MAKAPKEPPLSAAAREAIDAALDNGGIMVRLPGSWWTYKGCKIIKTIPEWSTTWPCLKALLRRGIFEPTKTDIGQWGEFVCEMKLTAEATARFSIPAEPQGEPVNENT